MIRGWSQKRSEWKTDPDSRAPMPGIASLWNSGREDGADGEAALQAARLDRPVSPPRRGEPETRFEFRCWPSADQIEAFDHTFASWTEDETETRLDTYVLWLKGPRFLPKLRDGEQFEIKECLSVEGRIEHWALAAQSRFPIEDRLKLWLEETGNFGPCMASQWGASVHGFLCQASIEPDWQAIDLIKSRRTFRKGRLRGELTEVSCRGSLSHTVAVESEDLRALEDVIGRPAFEGLANRSYGAYLRDMLGRSA